MLKEKKTSTYIRRTRFWEVVENTPQKVWEKDLFDNVAARNIINFIKESHFYSTV